MTELSSSWRTHKFYHLWLFASRQKSCSESVIQRATRFNKTTRPRTKCLNVHSVYKVWATDGLRVKLLFLRFQFICTEPVRRRDPLRVNIVNNKGQDPPATAPWSWTRLRTEAQTGGKSSDSKGGYWHQKEIPPRTLFSFITGDLLQIAGRRENRWMQTICSLLVGY